MLLRRPMSRATHMKKSVLATALMLARLHGTRYAASYLHEMNIDIQVAPDLQDGRLDAGKRISSEAHHREVD
jgi:hypothetical protein